MASSRASWVAWMVLGMVACGHSEEPTFADKVEAYREAQSTRQVPANGKTAQAAPKAHEPAAPKAPPPPPPPRPPTPSRPDAPDPEAGEFTLAEALDGLAGKGPLGATITTNLGALQCKLFDDKAPNTVANFVGLARGKRAFWDSNEGAWVKRPYFDGTTFHRVIPGFMIQGGDYTGTGAGGIGYTIADELHPSLAHDRPGLLCMANRGPNTNGAQFFILDAPAPHLTQMKSYTIFGECGPTEVISKIANAPRRGERPQPPVVMESVVVARGKR